MKRREFMSKTGCGFAGLVASPLAFNVTNAGGQAKSRKYKIDIEIYEAKKDSKCHKKGDKFEYPKDIGKICPWLLASMHDFLRLMEYGVTFDWTHEGTPYEKVIDPDGVTTEFVRCPDPKSNLVAKIIRTAV